MMSRTLRLAIAASIWPGPINGPLPVTLFKFLTISLIALFGVVPATIVMGTLASVLVLFFYESLFAEGALDKVNHWIERLPPSYQKSLKVGTEASLLPLVFSAGPFPLALAFRLLNFRGARAKALLVAGTYANSILWTGLVWGSGITILKSFL